MTDEDAQKAIDFIRFEAGNYANAKAERIYYENALKSTKAVIMSHSDEKTIGGKEIEAYAHPHYEENLQMLRKHVITEETLKAKMKAAELTFEKWRVQSYNNRVEAKLMS